MEIATSTADVNMDLHIRGFMIMMIFYISAFSLFVHNLFCGGKHYVGSDSVSNYNFISDKMRKNSNIDFHAANISKSYDDDDDGNLYNPVSNIAFASNYKNKSTGKNYDCTITDDLGLSLLFLLLITYIMHILEFWHSNTWIELRSIVEWPTAHKLITNCSRASPVIWWRVLTYRRRMRWNLEKVLPQRFVKFLTTSKDCTNFRRLHTSRSFAQFHSQMESNNHHEPPSIHPSLHSFNSSIHPSLHSFNPSIHPSVHYSKPSCSTSSKTAIRPSESLMTTASTRPLFVMSSSSSSSSVMTSCNENLCGIATNHSNTYCSVCYSHCHHQHNHRHHHFDDNHHDHRYDHIQHHQDFNFLHPPKIDQTHSTHASVSDDPEILDSPQEDGRMDGWFARLLRRMLTEKHSQAEFCSAFDHTQFSVTDATACLDLSTFTSHITRVQIKKICNLSSTSSLIEYNKQKSSFIDEVLFKREVDENNLRVAFDGFIEMTETFDLVSFNVDPTLNSSAYNIVLHYPSMFIVSKPGGSTPWFSKTVTLWLAALTVLSWPLRILISHKKVTICCPVIKIFGISKDKSTELTNTPRKIAPSSTTNSTPKKEMPIIDTNFNGGGNENEERTPAHDVFKNSTNGAINQKALSISAESRKNGFKTFINHGEPLSNSKDNYNNQMNEIDGWKEDTPPSYEEVLNMNTTEFNSSQGQCYCGCHRSKSNATPQVIKLMSESPVNTGCAGNSLNHRKEIKSVDEKWPIRSGRKIFGRLFQNKIYHTSKTRILQLMETSL